MLVRVLISGLRSLREWGVRILDFRLRLLSASLRDATRTLKASRSVERFWIKELKFNPKDVRGLALSEREQRL